MEQKKLNDSSTKKRKNKKGSIIKTSRRSSRRDKNPTHGRNAVLKEIIEKTYTLTIPERVELDIKSAMVYMNGREVSWFGKISKQTEETFTLENIYFPPQLCSPTYVETNDELFSKWWFDNVITKGIVQNVRLHGHTHPNMMTNPSGTDVTQFAQIRKEVDDFYIQMIVNEKMEYFCKYHDITTNKMIEVKIIFQGQERIDETLKDVVKNRVVTYTPSTVFSRKAYDHLDYLGETTYKAPSKLPNTKKVETLKRTYRDEYIMAVNRITKLMYQSTQISTVDEYVELEDNVQFFLHSEIFGKLLTKSLEETRNAMSIEQRVARDLMRWGIGYDILSEVNKERDVYKQMSLFEFVNEEPYLEEQIETYNPFPEIEEYEPKNIGGDLKDVEFE